MDKQYFKHTKQLQDLIDGDIIYCLDLVELKIHEYTVNKLTIESTIYTDYDINDVVNYEYNKVSFCLNFDDNTHWIREEFGVQTSILLKNRNMVLCTTMLEAKHISNIIQTKCNIQINQFKRIFNGEGFNYEPRHYKCR